MSRLSVVGRDAFRYEATIEDPKVFTRPWKISMPIYRRLEPNAQLMEFACHEMVEETIWGISASSGWSGTGKAGR